MSDLHILNLPEDREAAARAIAAVAKVVPAFMRDHPGAEDHVAYLYGEDGVAVRIRRIPGGMSAWVR